jgi:hypothetical protein
MSGWARTERLQPPAGGFCFISAVRWKEAGVCVISVRHKREADAAVRRRRVLGHLTIAPGKYVMDVTAQH